MENPKAEPISAMGLREVEVNDQHDYKRRIEMFARDTADGWDSWGNEIKIDLRGGATKVDKRKYPKRGGNCEFTEDCMWGVDGWCDRPERYKCVLQETDEKKEDGVQ